MVCGGSPVAEAVGQWQSRGVSEGSFGVGGGRHWSVMKAMGSLAGEVWSVAGDVGSVAGAGESVMMYD